MADMSPIRQSTLCDQVIERLKDHIADQGLGPGAKLPTERALTKTLGVSRNVLREALKSLRAVGLIEIRQGSGMHVAEFDASRAIAHVSFGLSRDGSDRRDLARTVALLETAAMQEVVRNMRLGDLEELEQCNRRLADAGTPGDAADADMAFHKRLLEMTRNHVLADIGSFLAQCATDREVMTGIDEKQALVGEHSEVIRALRRGDVRAAANALRRHGVRGCSQRGERALEQ